MDPTIFNYTTLLPISAVASKNAFKEVATTLAFFRPTLVVRLSPRVQHSADCLLLPTVGSSSSVTECFHGFLGLLPFLEK